MRKICDFAQDNGVPADPTTLNTNPIVLSAIRGASNKILMSCRVANRYLQADLDKLFNDADRRDSLVRLTCDLAFGLLVSRRGLSLKETTEQAPMYTEALDTLEMLERGVRVLDDSPPDGTDAPTAGAKVEVVGNAVGVCTWTQQTDNRIFPVGGCGCEPALGR